MTEQQQQLAMKYAKLVGMKHVDDHGFGVPMSPGEWYPLTWLFTGDGMLAVKAEMAKRGFAIGSGPCLADPRFWADAENGQDWEGELFEIGPSEPEAVLMAAVAAMEKKCGH